MHAKAPVTPPKAAPLTPPKMLPHGKVIPARPQRPSGNVVGPQMGSGVVGPKMGSGAVAPKLGSAVAPNMGSMGPPPAPSRAAELLEELSKKELRPGDPAPKERGPDGRGARPPLKFGAKLAGAGSAFQKLAEQAAELAKCQGELGNCQRDLDASLAQQKILATRNSELEKSNEHLTMQYQGRPCSPCRRAVKRQLSGRMPFTARRMRGGHCWYSWRSSRPGTPNRWRQCARRSSSLQRIDELLL